jgi:hypothetical protein
MAANKETSQVSTHMYSTSNKAPHRGWEHPITRIECETAHQGLVTPIEVNARALNAKDAGSRQPFVSCSTSKVGSIVFSGLGEPPETRLIVSMSVCTHIIPNMQSKCHLFGHSTHTAHLVKAHSTVDVCITELLIRLRQ